MTPSAVVSSSPVPANIEEYEGKWVAVRDGEVVASADTLEELAQQDDVRQDDAVFHVPGSGYYLL